MSAELGPVAYGQKDEPIFLGKEIARHKDYSDDTASRIDAAVNSILNTGRGLAETLLSENRAVLDRLALALLDKETLSGEEVRALL
jgi:cell division protease FtsH